jgi:hypothetical protein
MKSTEKHDHDERDDAGATEEAAAAGDSSTGPDGGSRHSGPGGGSEGYGPGSGPWGYGPGGYGPGGYGGGRGDGGSNGRLRSDPILTQRFQALDDALQGPVEVARPQVLTWSGINETTAAFTSIQKALGDSVPEDRPTSDLPKKYGNQRTGG